METKTKTFDAVAESRKWREATSRKLDAMTPEQRIAYLRAVGERYAAERAARQAARSLQTASS
jgi:uncharacterized small protein (DUF1192 family)